MSSSDSALLSKSAGEFASLTRLPITSFSVDNVPAPTNLYIGQDGFLRVTVRSVVGGAILTVRTRAIRSDDGSIATSEDVILPGASGAQQVFIVNLTEGFLLSAIITSDGGAEARGSIFCSMELARGSSQAPHRDALLLQDYVATGYAVAWPGGQIRLSTEGPGTSTFFQAGAPGAGTEFLTSFAVNTRNLLKSLVVQLVTSAVAGARVPVFNFILAGAPVYSVGIVGTIPASTTATLVLGAGIAGPSVNNNVHLLPLPLDLRVINPTTLGTTTTGLLAGDNYGIASGIRETWIDG